MGIAREVGMARGPVGEWRRRFAEKRLAGIKKAAPRRGKPSSDRAELTEHSTHWSTCTLAKEQGVSDTRVARVWRAHGLQPHRTKTFKVRASDQNRFASSRW